MRRRWARSRPRGSRGRWGAIRLNGLRGLDAGEAVTMAGRHVSVNIPHPHHVQEAIDELRHMEKDLARHLPVD